MLKKFLNFNLISIFLILLIAGFLLVFFSTGPPPKSQIMEKVGMAVAQTPTRWNNWQDAAAGNILSNGLPGVVLYVDDGAGNFIRAGLTSSFFVSTATSPTIVTGQAAVNGMAGGNLIAAANVNRKSIIVRNMGAANIFIGPTGVTTGTGLILKVGEILILDRNTAAIYGIAETGATNATVGYLIE